MVEHEVPDEERFQYWLVAMDESIHAFQEALPQEDRDCLDFSPQSLLRLEHALLARYGSLADAKQPVESAFLDGAARYFGEVLRKASGARWELRTADEAFVFHGIPILYGGQIKTVPVCPLMTVTACVDRRSGDYLKRIFDNLIST